jgi:hypothetical protein
MKRTDLNVWMQFSYFFDYVPVFSKFQESRRVSDESWQESLGDGRAHGYGAGTSTSVAKAGFNRDSREGDVSG